MNCPENHSQNHKNRKACPHESAARSAWNVRRASASRTTPAPAKPQRKKWNPEKVANIKATDLLGPARPRTKEAVVVAKRCAFRAKVVNTVDKQRSEERRVGKECR